MDDRGDWTLIGAPPFAPQTNAFGLRVLRLTWMEWGVWGSWKEVSSKPSAPRWSKHRSKAHFSLYFSPPWFIKIVLREDEWLEKLYVWALLLTHLLFGAKWEESLPPGGWGGGEGVAITFHSLRRKLKNLEWGLTCGPRGPPAIQQDRWWQWSQVWVPLLASLSCFNWLANP